MRPSGVRSPPPTTQRRLDRSRALPAPAASVRESITGAIHAPVMRSPSMRAQAASASKSRSTVTEPPMSNTARPGRSNAPT